MENRDPAADRPDRWAGNPLRLPRLRREAIHTITGDRRPGVRFCAGCGSSLEGGAVVRGYWAYCSIDCAIRTEKGD